MEKDRFRLVLINCIVLFIGLVFFLTKEYKIALFLILLGFLSMIWAIFTQKIKIKNNKKIITKSIIFFLILAIILNIFSSQFLFNQKINLLGLILIIPLILVIWFYIEYNKNRWKEKNESVVTKFPLLYSIFILAIFSIIIIIIFGLIFINSFKENIVSPFLITIFLSLVLIIFLTYKIIKTKTIKGVKKFKKNRRLEDLCNKG